MPEKAAGKSRMLSAASLSSAMSFGVVDLDAPVPIQSCLLSGFLSLGTSMNAVQGFARSIVIGSTATPEASTVLRVVEQNVDTWAVHEQVQRRVLGYTISEVSGACEL